MILRANAKVNLHLDIGPRRPDGYHSLQTVFQEISLHDTLRFKLSGTEIKLVIDGKSGLPVNSDNLIVRALQRLQKKLKAKKGIVVRLTKRIPMGAGLGGGSSDAAAALWGGWLLWTGKKTRPKTVPAVLKKLAGKLGADVPFFLEGGTCWAEGIGEKLKPFPAQPKRWMVLVYPRVHVSTPLAYNLLDRFRVKRDNYSITFNSFEPVILKKYPQIAQAKKMLIALGCSGVMMSGSGSTVFGFVKNPQHGKNSLAHLKRRGWPSFLAHTL